MSFCGYFRSVLVFMMILTVSGVVCGEGLSITNNTDRRIQKGGAWGLGGLGSSTGLLSRSLKYNSDMAITGVGVHATSSTSSSSGNVGGLSGGYKGASASRNSLLKGGNSSTASAGAGNKTYTAQTIGDLKPTDLGKYKSGSDYTQMLGSLKQNLKPEIGKYEIESAGNAGWDRKDTLESQLTGGKKYGMKMNTSIARSDAYVQALAASGYLKDEKISMADSSRITTLVPKNGGEFSELIRRGEDAFKKELFQEALGYFKLARRISPRSPEVLLSLFNASFAASSGLSYSLPAYYLQLSLKYFPELPLVDVHPKYFYEREGDFVRDQVRLENYLDEQNRDPQAMFVMGYIKWRNGDVAQSCKYLQNCYDISQDRDMQDAVQIMWDGMIASGKVNEKLVLTAPKKPDAPASLPAVK